MNEPSWDAARYAEDIVAEIPAYHELQSRTVEAAAGMAAARILDLGVGTGETAGRVLELYPDAMLTGIDSSPDMLARAAERLSGADLRLRRLEDDLPDGPFDLVVSALAVHHLDSAGKRDLFARVASVLSSEGRFVLADVVVPEDPAAATIPIDGVYDRPDRLADQLEWLHAAGLTAEPVWVAGDLAVVRASRPTRLPPETPAGRRAAPRFAPGAPRG